ncbi:hypothetical protein [Bacillus ndiopicus]|uniref:hypothetical protein n=1 Tax=Bacillus ndiopicus TaxID=1347368 RepID=UPI0005A778A2|nr:hypothetical protein [Bacillus ndiopicus]
MDDKRLEMRMNKLKKHYESMPSLIDVDAITTNLPENPPRKRSKRGHWFIAIVSACIMAILVPFYITQQQDMQAFNEVERLNNERYALAQKEFEEWRQSLAVIYKEQKELQRQALHLTENQFNSLAYVQEAEGRYQFYTSDEAMQRYSKGAWQSQLNIVQNNIVEQLDSPLSMLAKPQVFQDDKEEIAYLQSYIAKIKALDQLYRSIEYTPEIIAAAKDEGFVLTEFNAKTQLAFDYTLIQKELFHTFSPETIGFFEVLKMERYIYAGELVVSAKEAAKSALLLEKTLLVEQYDEYNKHLKNSYEFIMLKLFTGGEAYPIKNQDGTYNQDYIHLLQFLIAEDSAVASIATSILAEIAATGESATIENIDYRDIWNAMLLVKYPF